MRWHTHVRDERGIAMVFSLITLLSLSGLALAMLTMSALEPQIAQNLADSTEARHVADSGVDWAYDQLATATTNWTTLLTGATAASCNAGGTGILFGNANQTLGTLTAVRGTYTVRVRNDCQPNDT